jgi:hypothetical protein
MSLKPGHTTGPSHFIEMRHLALVLIARKWATEEGVISEGEILKTLLDAFFSGGFSNPLLIVLDDVKETFPDDNGPEGTIKVTPDGLRGRHGVPLETPHDPESYSEDVGRVAYLEKYAVTKADFEGWCNENGKLLPRFWFGEQVLADEGTKPSGGKTSVQKTLKKDRGPLNIDDYAIKNRIESILAAAGKHKGLPVRQIARLLVSERKNQNYRAVTIRKILGRSYKPAKRLGIAGY